MASGAISSVQDFTASVSGDTLTAEYTTVG